MNLNQLLIDNNKNLKKPALIDDDNNIVYSYDDLIKSINILGNIFLQNSVKPKNKIAIYMSNSINWIIAFYTVLKIGAVPVLIDSQFTLRELKECLEISGTNIIITDDNQNKKNILISLEDLDRAFIFSKNQNHFNNNYIYIYDAILDSNYSTINLDNADDNEIILFTYRGLGFALPVLFDEKSIVNSVINNIDLTEINPELVIGLFLPSHHIFALTSNILSPLSVNGTIIISNNYIPINILRIIERYKINFLLAVPTVIKILIHSLKKKSYDLTSIKKGIIGGDKFDKLLSDEWMSITGNRLMQGYGLTETCPVICNGLKYNKVESIGRLLGKVQAKILDNNGKPLNKNAAGRLWIKSDTMLSGYYNLKELNDKFIINGFIDTGDAVYKDDDDFYFFVKREKQIAKIGGTTVDINEIYKIAENHPDIDDIKLELTADSLWNEKLVLNVFSKKQLNKMDVITYLKNNLSPSKIPREIIINN